MFSSSGWEPPSKILWPNGEEWRVGWVPLSSRFSLGGCPRVRTFGKAIPWLAVVDCPLDPSPANEGPAGRQPGAPLAGTARPAGRSPLLSSHNRTDTPITRPKLKEKRCSLEIASNGSYNRIRIPQLPKDYNKMTAGLRDDDETTGDRSNKRAAIKGFSAASAGRFKDHINCLDNEKLGKLKIVFVTLTFHKVFPGPRDAKSHLKRFFRKMVREFGGYGYWKLEPQKRGAAHFHLVLFLQPSQVEAFKAWVPPTWFDIGGYSSPQHLAWHKGELGNGNKHCCEVVKGDRKCILNYLGKYIGKRFDHLSGWAWPGRFWGIIQPDKVAALTTVRTFHCSRAAAIKLRRIMWRWLQRQQTGSYWVVDHGNNNDAGLLFGVGKYAGTSLEQWRKRPRKDRRYKFKTMDAEHVAAFQKCGLEVVPVCRKVHKTGGGHGCRHGGGARVYMPDIQFQRLVEWIASENGTEVNEVFEEVNESFEAQLEGCPI